MEMPLQLTGPAAEEVAQALSVQMQVLKLVGTAVLDWPH
jgi:hypothetical protein